jgi:outer membrane immunogenic protein
MCWQIWLASLSVAVLAASGAASAQSNPAPIWAGAYVGVHADYGNGELSETSILDFKGYAAGLHAGYNFQSGPVVLGVEGDFSFTGIEDEYRTNIGSVAVRLSMETPYLASVRGRLGLALGPMLVYGTGGMAFTRLEVKASATAGVDSVSVKTAVAEQGYTFGGGVEYMLSPRLIGRIEGLRYQFDKVDNSSESYRVDVWRAGLSYKF